MKLPVIQKHHITYNPERTVHIYKGEHMLLTRLQWRKRLSEGFIESLIHFINTNSHKAINLETAYSIQKQLRGARKCKKSQ